MEKRLAFCFVFLFLISGVYGVSSDLRAEYERGETIIAEIRGNILDPIDRGQVDFRRGHISVPLEFDLKRLGDKYYIWAIAPDNEENYTLVIEGIVTTVSGKTEEIDFQQDFRVGENLVEYSVRPGFFLTEKDFEIQITSNVDDDIGIEVNREGKSEVLNTILKPGKNEIELSVESFLEEGLYEVFVGMYTIPVYFLGSDSNITVVGENPLLRVNPLVIESTILAGDEGKPILPFNLVNFGGRKISDIDINYDEELFEIDLSGEDRIEIESETVIDLELVVVAEITDELRESGIDEVIEIRVGEFVLELPVKISFTLNESQVKTDYLEEDQVLYYCKQIDGGELCLGGDVCSGVEQASLDGGTCCVGECVEEGGGGGSRAWIGWVLGGIVLIVLIVVFLKYRKAKKNKKGFGERVKIAEGKMPGKVEGGEEEKDDDEKKKS